MPSAPHNTRKALFVMWSLDHQALRAQTAGRFDEEERLTEQLSAIGPSAAGHVGRVLGINRTTMIRREQGRLGKLEMAARQRVARYPDLATCRIALAWIYTETGHSDEARREFETVTRRARRFSTIGCVRTTSCWDITSAPRFEPGIAASTSRARHTRRSGGSDRSYGGAQ